MKYDDQGNFVPMSDKEAVSTARRWIIGILITLVVVGGVGAFVAWDAGWWFNNQNVNRQALLLQHSYGAQSAYTEEVQNEIVEFNTINVQLNDPSTPASEKPSLLAQQQALVNQACGQIGRVTYTLPKEEATWSASYCSN